MKEVELFRPSYSVFGGIPYYNRIIDPNKTVKENIIELIASADARFANEIPMFLKAEISKINNANAIFEALSAGSSKFSDILDRSHINSSSLLSDVLNRLINMSLLKKQTPINDENNKKKTFYRIQDNLSRFYYRYIFRHLSQFQVLDAEHFFERYINEDFETQFVPECFEEVCRQYLIRQNRRGSINPPFFRIGKYYYDLPKERRNGEFDIVTEDEHGYICYEAKFQNHPLSPQQLEDEIAQIKDSPLEAYRFGFISKTRFSDLEPDSHLVLYTLEDLYRD